MNDLCINLLVLMVPVWITVPHDFNLLWWPLLSTGRRQSPPGGTTGRSQAAAARSHAHPCLLREATPRLGDPARRWSKQVSKLFVSVSCSEIWSQLKQCVGYQLNWCHQNWWLGIPYPNLAVCWRQYVTHSLIVEQSVTHENSDFAAKPACGSFMEGNSSNHFNKPVNHC